MKKKGLLLSLLSSLLLIPSALADITDTLGNVARKIVDIFNLDFLNVGPDAMVIAFTRMLIWLLLFCVFFAVIVGLGKGGRGGGYFPMKLFTRAQAGIVSAVVATIAAVFLPGPVLAAAGAGWATAIALLLIGGPVVGLGYLLITIPGKEDETRGSVLIKIILCLIILWILTAMRHHLGRLGV